jgi:VanZ family protein
VVLWAALIYLLSARPDVGPGGPPPSPWGFYLRKLAHLVEYAVLSGLLWRALGDRRSPAFRFGWAVAICVVYGVTDEIHQSFVPGRFGKVRDVVIDTVGAGAAAFVLWKKHEGEGDDELHRLPVV